MHICAYMCVQVESITMQALLIRNNLSRQLPPAVLVLHYHMRGSSCPLPPEDLRCFLQCLTYSLGVHELIWLD